MAERAPASPRYGPPVLDRHDAGLDELHAGVAVRFQPKIFPWSSPEEHNDAVTYGQAGAVCPQCGSAAAVHSVDELAAMARTRLGQFGLGYQGPPPGYQPPGVSGATGISGAAARISAAAGFSPAAACIGLSLIVVWVPLGAAVV